MIKKKISFLLVFLLSLFFIIIPSFHGVRAKADSTEVTVSFELRINDKNVVLANKDDIVDVDFIIKRTDSNGDYTTNGFQNEIYFDMEAFEFVENSIVCYDTGMPTAKYQDNIEHGKIIQCANMGNTYTAEFKFCSFQLRAIKDNVSGMVYNSNQQIYDLNHSPIPFKEENLRVMVGIDCDHTSKTEHAQTESTCIDNGNEAYKQCTVCDALFDMNDELIAEIVYLPLADHTGGHATCTEKAVCSVCNQEYGQLEETVHAGEIVIINQKPATKNEEGYTGDKICSCCFEVVEKGVVIPASDSTSNGEGDVNINIDIDGDNNIVGDNNTINVYYEINDSTMVIVVLAVIALLLLAIVVLLAVLCFKVKSVQPPMGPCNLPPLPPKNEGKTVVKIVIVGDRAFCSTDKKAEEAPAEESAQEVAVSAQDEAAAEEEAIEEVVVAADEAVAEDTLEVVEAEEVDEADEVEQEGTRGFAEIVKKPFATKLAEASKTVKAYYNELRNTLLSYNKVKSRVSNKFDSLYAGRTQLAKFAIRGKSLYIYLALDANALADTKYNVSESQVKTYAQTPCQYKVNGERKLLWAKELIAKLAEKHQLTEK